MSLDFASVWGTMLPVGRGFSVLFAAAAASLVGLTVERIVALTRADDASRTFAALAGKLADERRFEELAKAASQHQTAPLARLFGAIAFRYNEASDEANAGCSPAIDLARNESSRSLARLGEEAYRRVGVISTLATLAPFGGALGTTLALIEVFCYVGAAPSPTTGALLTGVAGALVPLALGLTLAILARALSAHFSARAGIGATALASSAGEFLDALEHRQSNEASAVRRAA